MCLSLSLFPLSFFSLSRTCSHTYTHTLTLSVAPSGDANKGVIGEKSQTRAEKMKYGVVSCFQLHLESNWARVAFTPMTERRKAFLRLALGKPKLISTLILKLTAVANCTESFHC